ncbi:MULTISPECIES: DUF2934 domain-containing protein [unclassified Methylobacterium]|uniref:DUF2934 domain-containing protein n=1 Tax=unclassified Methylobacterium TaxID=2615210 RepID=UPI00226AF2A8|nr:MULTISPECIES: DUF2934 domain-containing protein [unclassified Methylobacterium]
MQISEHHVRECAYFIWENEGRIHGQAVAHWMRAETELHANATLAAGTVIQAVTAEKAAIPASAKVAAPKAAAPKSAALKAAAPKAATKAAAPKTAKAVAPQAAAKPAAPKPAPVKAAAKPTAPKPVRASKVAVTAGLAAKAKPARTPAAMH